MKCYTITFSKDGIIQNIGFYIITSNIFFHFICIIIFYKNDFIKIKNKISEIIYSIKNTKNRNKNAKKSKDKKNEVKKNNKRKKINKSISINIIQTSSNTKNNFNISNNTSKQTIKLNNRNMKVIIKYNIYELNNLSYKEALKYDKRTYIQYYLSLIETKHKLFFSFSSVNDYNSRIIKIYLFFFSFTIEFLVNALFFNDSTIHTIYKDNGSFNINYQIVQIIYSSLISSILNIILKTLALTERSILKIKQFKNINKINNISKK